MKTPKGTKPNTQHRTAHGRYASYEEANRARHAYILAHDVRIKTATIRRVGDHFTLRIDSVVSEEVK